MNVSAKLFLTLTLAIISFALNCASSFNKLVNLHEYENLVLYKLEAKVYPQESKMKKQMASMKEFPKLGPEQIMDVLGNFVYVQDSLWGRVQRRVFYKEELEYMAPYISQQLDKLGDQHRLVIVSRYDPDKSVLSRMERVSALMWFDEEGLNIVFGEIRTEIPRSDHLFEGDEWKNIYPVSLNRAYYDIALLKDDFFEKKVINGKVHETWAQIPEKNLQTLRYKPPEEKKTSDASSKDLSSKLKSLQKAKEEGLITEEEYQVKRKQLIDSY